MSCVLIVDDNPLVRKAIRHHLTAAGVEICVEAVDGFDALEKVPAVHPTLVILDLVMPRLGGLEAAKRLRKLRPCPPVILLTLHAEVFRAQPLPEGVDLVIAKGDPLVPSVLAMLAAS
jgi:two-component system response regulator MprA